MMRKCILVLSISLFFTAGFIMYKASKEDNAAPFRAEAAAGKPAPAVAKSDIELQTSADAKALQQDDVLPVSGEEAIAPASASTDDVFKQVAALQQPAVTQTPALQPAAEKTASATATSQDSSLLATLAEAATKRAEYADRVQDISSQLEVIQAEYAAMQTQMDDLLAKQTQLHSQKEQMVSLQQDRAALESSLATLDAEIHTKSNAMQTAQESTRQLQAAKQRLDVLDKQFAAQQKKLQADKNRMAQLETNAKAQDDAIARMVESIAALEKTRDDSQRLEASLADVGDAATDMQALRKNFSNARKAAETALGQKQAAKQKAEQARTAIFTEREALVPAMSRRAAELETLGQERSQLQALVDLNIESAESFGALKNAVELSKRQRQQVIERLATVAEQLATLETAAQGGASISEELATLESGLATADKKMSRLTRDRETYQTQLTSLDAQIMEQQGQLRQVLALADKALGGDSFPPKEQSDRSLIVSLTDTAFDGGEAILQATARAQIASAVQKVRSLPGYRVSVEGHTDDRPLAPSAVPQYQDNIGLSFHRAKSVADALIKQGLDPSLISVAAHGFGKPTTANDSTTGRAKNRRVEIWLVAN